MIETTLIGGRAADGAEGAKVDQVQGQVRIGEVLPGRWVLVIPALVRIVGMSRKFEAR